MKEVNARMGQFVDAVEAQLSDSRSAIHRRVVMMVRDSKPISQVEILLSVVSAYADLNDEIDSARESDRCPDWSALSEFMRSIAESALLYVSAERLAGRYPAIPPGPVGPPITGQ